jgi:uncharacterized protein
VASAPLDRIVWERLDMPGMEWCEIRRAPRGTRIDGIALVAHTGTPYRIEYTIELDAEGRTRKVAVRPRGAPTPAIALEADGGAHWVQGGVPIADLAGCLDVDLGFSPMTNSLPIWRLGLAPAETREIRAAWVRFPEFTVEVLRQTYERTDASTYVYRSDGFEARLRVDAEGIVAEYGSYWRAVAHQHVTADR